MKTAIAIISAVGALLIVGCQAPSKHRSIVKIDTAEIAYDGVQEERLDKDHSTSDQGGFRFVGVTSKGARIELRDGSVIETNEGAVFSLADGRHLGIKLLEINRAEESILVSYPFGETWRVLRTYYSDGSYDEVRIVRLQ